MTPPGNSQPELPAEVRVFKDVRFAPCHALLFPQASKSPSLIVQTALAPKHSLVPGSSHLASACFSAKKSVCVNNVCRVAHDRLVVCLWRPLYLQCLPLGL
eukprot:1159420-Pelagomonas_calceolata.AAC.16